jgi:hypothetical protein
MQFEFDTQLKLYRPIQTRAGRPPLISTDTAAHSTGAKRPRREADNSLPSTMEVKNGGAITLLPHVSLWRGCILSIHKNSYTEDCPPQHHSPNSRNYLQHL